MNLLAVSEARRDRWRGLGGGSPAVGRRAPGKAGWRPGTAGQAGQPAQTIKPSGEADRRVSAQPGRVPFAPGADTARLRPPDGTSGGRPCRPATSGRQAAEAGESQAASQTRSRSRRALVLKTRAPTRGANTPRVGRTHCRTSGSAGKTAPVRLPRPSDTPAEQRQDPPLAAIPRPIRGKRGTSGRQADVRRPPLSPAVRR
jgi:hypothetical protein